MSSVNSSCNQTNDEASLQNGDFSNITIFSDAGSDTTNPDSFGNTLRQLVDRKYLIPVHEPHFRSDADNQRVAEHLATEKLQSFGTLKGQEKAQFEKTVREILEGWRFGPKTGTQELSRRMTTGLSRGSGKKRPLSSTLPEGKVEGQKRRLGNNGGTLTDGQPHTESADLMPDLTVSFPSSSQVPATHDSLMQGDYLRINYDRLAMLVRLRALASKAGTCISKVTAEVYSKILDRMEKDILDASSLSPRHLCPDDEGRGPCIATRDILSDASTLANLVGSIGTAEPAMIDVDNVFKGMIRSRRTIDDGEDEGGFSNDEPSEDGRATDGEDQGHETWEFNDAAALDESGPIRQHLLLLAEHSMGFLTCHQRVASSEESWSVPFNLLVNNIRLTVLFETIRSRYGRAAVRLARILHEKGKLDEKALASRTLLAQKELRQALAAMHRSGFLELQEIPRDNQRQPARTMFLWFFDPQRCALNFVDSTYKTMARLVQRMQYERESAKGVIAKSNRSDVIGREEEFLTKKELIAMRKWKSKETQLYGELSRLDDLICLMR
ncbi:MAG: RNA polymerase III subunit C82 [Stictis urceolatum]|nr:RNA polymerase III subunit C82 [Stictis urceolata]